MNLQAAVGFLKGSISTDATDELNFKNIMSG